MLSALRGFGVSVRIGAFGLGVIGLLVSGSAYSLERGDIIVRAGATLVAPNDDSDSFAVAPVGADNAEVGVDSAWSLGLTAAYMVTDNVGVELLAAWPFEHDITGEGDLSGLGTIASTRHLPPTLSLQYYFNVAGNLRPYAGVGVNYTLFFDEKSEGALEDLGIGDNDIDLDPSVGFAAQLGIDYEFAQRPFLLSADVRYISIVTDADIEGVGEFEVEINPWVVSLTAGYRF